ncbi:hypothetical protein DD876_13290, partial [Staphylococcus pseudintermedius]|uniref:hypothetical protein n=1 Tax=Staphylococcus pseudintermedius TaxID=283734 RepID=UPI000D858E5B
SHSSRANATDFALAQTSSGHTHLNAAGNPISGGVGFHLDGGSELGQLDYTGWTFGTTSRFTSGNVGIGTSIPGA